MMQIQPEDSGSRWCRPPNDQSSGEDHLTARKLKMELPEYRQDHIKINLSLNLEAELLSVTSLLLDSVHGDIII
jgi:hypothetical protein